MKLSIVIPVYNVEKYIEKCLLSCIKQDISYEDYEIIVVNDGSPDCSLNIAERIASSNKNVRIITQINGGLSVARNTGLKYAKGEYVWFIDADDWIEENCLGKLSSLFDGTDVIHIGYNLVYSNRVVHKSPVSLSKDENIMSKDILRPAPFYIMRLNFLKENNLTFKKGIFHEDTEFTPRILYLCKTIQIYPHNLYYYLQRENSIMSTVNPKRSFDLLIVAESLRKFRDEKVKNEIKPYFNNIISSCINASLNVIIKSNKKEQGNWLVKVKDCKLLLRSMLNSNKFRYKIQGAIFLTIPSKCILKAYKLMLFLR